MKKLFTLACLLCTSVVSMAQVTFTCTGGKNYDQGGEGDIKNIFDGREDTKYYEKGGDDAYALVTASEAVYLYGYDDYSQCSGYMGVSRK